MINDELVMGYLKKGPNMLVPWYLILSYAYYHLDETLVSDKMYDSICRSLIKALEAFDVDHRHMGLCDVDALKAGTAYHLKKVDYPGMAVSCAENFAKGVYP